MKLMNLNMYMVIVVKILVKMYIITLVDKLYI
jgi:hypothetical protein